MNPADTGLHIAGWMFSILSQLLTSYFLDLFVMITLYVWNTLDLFYTWTHAECFAVKSSAYCYLPWHSLDSCTKTEQRWPPAINELCYSRMLRFLIHLQWINKGGRNKASCQRMHFSTAIRYVLLPIVFNQPKLHKWMRCRLEESPLMVSQHLCMLHSGRGDYFLFF